MPAVRDMSYDAWLQHSFGPSVRAHGNPWFFDDDPPWWDPQPPVAIEYFTKLFSTTEQSLSGFSDAQIAQGLTYLLNTSASGDNGWFYSQCTAFEERLRCVAAIEHIFTDLFAPRCATVLGHIGEPGTKPLNMVCYMWWDVFPCLALPDDPNCDNLHRAAIEVMHRTLQLGSVACQEAALHGLGHWARDRPDDVGPVVDAFLADGRARRAALTSYAHAARCGCIL
ncbi:hypothetical protein SJ05684_b44810 (plasmid) [Sinorhizobium sojae CCBAU 05684]|uniref:Uncharacterized protein n=1 Tax=Sinorhizobium sojae CCBAU 05684 TaxID=716928 RepID=A0A249PHQ0_9HYPH|nr:hypothetical protein [Sinorhizobium sojae]ASY65463.1 hypothetical protein SJ05684_b44810 [Sinorhizobium sojae CCBAU 05684]